MSGFFASDAYLDALVWGVVIAGVIIVISEIVRAWRQR